MLRTLIVDDHELFREGLCALLASIPEITVIGQAADARDGLRKAQDFLPDLAIVDVTLPGSSGISLVHDLMRLRHKPSVLFLSMHQNEQLVRDAFAAQALGYALKDQPAREIQDAVRIVARGERYLAPTLSKDLMKGGGAQQSPVQTLSVREREIFDLAVRGFSNAAMAHELCISPKTVETHRARINKKLRVHSAAELVRFAARNGLIAPS